MAKIINSEDLFEKELFKVLIDEINKAETEVKKLEGNLTQLGSKLKESLQGAKIDNLENINKILNGSKEVNKAIEQQIQLEKKITELKSTKEKLESEILKKEQQFLKVTELRIKAENQQLKQDILLTKEQERKAKASEREVRANSSLSSTYARVNSWLGKLRNEYRDLAIKKELGVTLTSKEEFRYGVLEKRIQAYDVALKKVDASMGNHQRNVGNYASGWNGLSNSVNQLTREIPAFANSMQTGFMAISNNLPMFFDEIQKIKKSNVELKAQGLETKSVLTQLGTAIFSWGTALSVGVTLLTLYGAKMIDWVSNALKPANNELRQMEERQKRIDADKQKQAQYIGKESSMYVGLVLALKQTNAGSKERIELMNTINKDYGTTLKNLKDEKDFQDQLNKSIEQYLLFKEAEYKQKKNTELIEVGLAKREKLEYQLNKLEKERKQTMDDRMAAEIRFNIMKQNFDKQGLKDYNLLNLQQSAGILQYIELDEQISNTKEQISGINKRLEKYGLNIMNANKVTSKWTKETTKEIDNQTESQKEINLYTSKYLEILAKLIDLKEKDKSIKNESNLDKELQKQIENIRTTGNGQLKEIERLLQEGQQLEEDALLQSFNANEKVREQEYNAKLKELEKNRNQYEEGTRQYEEYQDAIAKLKYDYDKEGVLTSEEYNAKLNDITKKGFEKRTGIMKMLSDEWLEYYESLSDEEKKKLEDRLNDIKKLANSTNDLIQMGMDAYVKTLERNISLVEDRMNRLNQSIDFLQQKASTGNITANESLAKAQEDQLNAEKEKAKFQRTIQRMQFAMTIFNAYNSNIQNAKVGENPFTKTITDISALTAFVGSLPTFYEGTDTTIKDALGNPHLQGKDGYVVRVDGSEKVLNPYLSAKTGNLTTRDIAQIAEDRLKGKLVYGNEINSTANNMWANMQLIDEIQDLKSIIKNKPETNIAMGEIVGGVMKIVETTKVSNTTTRNIHRFNKKI